MFPFLITMIRRFQGTMLHLLAWCRQRWVHHWPFGTCMVVPTFWWASYVLAQPGARSVLIYIILGWTSHSLKSEQYSETLTCLLTFFLTLSFFNLAPGGAFLTLTASHFIRWLLIDRSNCTVTAPSIGYRIGLLKGGGGGALRGEVEFERRRSGKILKD